jgi:hypothetical protein
MKDKIPNAISIDEAAVEYGVLKKNLIDSIDKQALSYISISKDFNSFTYIVDVKELEAFLQEHPHGKVYLEKEDKVEKVNSKIPAYGKNSKKVRDMLYDKELERTFGSDLW